jgi:nitrate reductase beta subunit
MEKQAEQYIHGLPDVELLEYTRNSTHLTESLDFAKLELADRHISSERIAALEKQLQQRQEIRRQAAEARAAEPLIWEWRIAVFLCGLYFVLPLVFFVPAWLRFRDEGYSKKYKDMWVSALVGLCLQPILILLHLPPWSWLFSLF